jgi:hypothetical protein
VSNGDVQEVKKWAILILLTFEIYPKYGWLKD